MAASVQAPKAVKVLGVHTRSTFVKPAVQEIALTTKIIDAVMPYFPKACVCISGYLDSANQFWKVNYHWDYLVFKIDEFLARDIASLAKEEQEKLKKCAEAIKQSLLLRPPSPRTGYRTDPTVGYTKDSSTPEQVVERHKNLKQSKIDFEKVIVKAGVVSTATKKNPPTRAEKDWWLAVAPVAAPGTSKHGTGYALDIAGDNAETTRICKALGATLVFNEASHVHVEWASGVKPPPG